jgi:hypothetical protein
MSKKDAVPNGLPKATAGHENGSGATHSPIAALAEPSVPVAMLKERLAQWQASIAALQAEHQQLMRRLAEVEEQIVLTRGAVAGFDGLWVEV